MKPFTNNTGKVLTRYVKTAGATALMLNLKPPEAALLRSFTSSIRLRGDKVPSLSLVAHRALLVYLAHAQYSSETRTSEIAALEKLATPFSDRAKTKAIE
jgi:hypothetical protein